MEISGFHTPIKESHLPESVKSALIKYESIARDDNGNIVYTKTEYSEMTQEWLGDYELRSPDSAL